MRPNSFRRQIVGAIAMTIGVVVSRGTAQSFDVTMPTTADRWMYPFNVTPGTRPAGSVFGYTPFPLEELLDNRDGQVIVAFDTGDLIPSGAGPGRYQIDRLVLEITLSGPASSEIDVTVDDWRTYLPSRTAEALPDLDPGRPIELFGAGFRFGYDLLTWTEDAPFSDGDIFGIENRNVFAAGIDANGGTFDVSSNYTAGFTAEPLAVARFPGYDAGEFAIEGAVATVEVDLTVPGVRTWVGEGLDAGRLVFAITSLVGASQGDAVLTQFYLRENPLVEVGVREASTLDLAVVIKKGCDVPGDLDGDCATTGGDLGIFLSLWNTDDSDADFNFDGVVDGADLGLILGWIGL